VDVVSSDWCLVGKSKLAQPQKVKMESIRHAVVVYQQMPIGVHVVSLRYNLWFRRSNDSIRMSELQANPPSTVLRSPVSVQANATAASEPREAQNFDLCCWLAGEQPNLK
jgi:hypothetical protein